MICSKCNTKGVLNTVMGKDFFYCRTCKDEILPQVASGMFTHHWAAAEDRCIKCGTTSLEMFNKGLSTLSPSCPLERPQMPGYPTPTYMTAPTGVPTPQWQLNPISPPNHISNPGPPPASVPLPLGVQARQGNYFFHYLSPSVNRSLLDLHDAWSNFVRDRGQDPTEICLSPATLKAIYGPTTTGAVFCGLSITVVPSLNPICIRLS